MGWGASLACPQTSAVSENFTNLAENSSAASLAALTSLWYPESNVVAREKNLNHAAYSSPAQQQNITEKGLNLSQFPSPPVPPSHDKKSYTQCRYQQDKLDATFFGFGATIMPTTETAGSALGRPYHGALSPYSSTPHHETITNGHHVLTPVSSGSHAQSSALISTTASIASQHQTTNPTNCAMNNTATNNTTNTNSNNTNGSLFGSHHYTNGQQYHSVHDTTVRSCALPSPTIYPPTPPPSAPWIHPWFVGDTF